MITADNIFFLKKKTTLLKYIYSTFTTKENKLPKIQASVLTLKGKNTKFEISVPDAQFDSFNFFVAKEIVKNMNVPNID